jgi:hypothetical protein
MEPGVAGLLHRDSETRQVVKGLRRPAQSTTDSISAPRTRTGFEDSEHGSDWRTPHVVVLPHHAPTRDVGVSP